MSTRSIATPYHAVRPPFLVVTSKRQQIMFSTGICDCDTEVTVVCHELVDEFVSHKPKPLQGTDLVGEVMMLLHKRKVDELGSLDISMCSTPASYSLYPMRPSAYEYTFLKLILGFHSAFPLFAWVPNIG